MHEKMLNEVIEAIEFISGDPAEAEGYICIATGEVFTYWSQSDAPSALPGNVSDESLYLPLPTKQELRLGASLAIDFAAEHCPESLEEIHGYFRKPGAYRKFKAFLESVNLLEAWYQYQQESMAAAVKNWLQPSGIATAT